MKTGNLRDLFPLILIVAVFAFLVTTETGSDFELAMILLFAGFFCWFLFIRKKRRN